MQAVQLQAGNAQSMNTRFIAGDVARGFARVKIKVIPAKSKSLAGAIDKQPFLPQPKRPQKRHTLQVA